MSEDPDFVAEYSSNVVANYCFTAGAVMFLYDIILTTGDEVNFFWKRKLTTAAVLFWLNKYIMAFGLVWSFGTSLSMSDETCAASGKGVTMLNVLPLLVWAAFLSIRVYALRKGLFLPSFIFVLSVVPLGTNIATFWFGLTGENIYPFGCVVLDSTPEDLVKKSFLLILSD